jgi:N-hydroxyarylamine O-acetyltransferase
MNKQKYLERIGYDGIVSVTNKTLSNLHSQHVHSIPFENLDVHYKKSFDLHIENIFRKVIRDFRGGFCYELNLLFNWLLVEIGFSSRIIASRTISEDGTVGPEFDHMSVYVKTDREFLIDVGYGDLFLKPLEIKDGVQSDGRKFFRIENLNHLEYLLSMSDDGVEFKKRYTFSLHNVTAENFSAICFEKQTNPNSFFVKNLICTKPTDRGRVTIFNNKLIKENDESRTELALENDDELRRCLWYTFRIVVR